MARKKGRPKERKKDPEVPRVSRKRLVAIMKHAAIGAAELDVSMKHLFRRL